MNFQRAKTILIFIFVFVNIFLLLVYNFFILNKKTIDKDTLITVLSNNNVYVDEALIKDRDVSLKGVEVKNLVNDKENLLSSFLGKEYTKGEENYFKNDKAGLLITDSSVDFSIFAPKERKYKDIKELNAGSKVIGTLAKYGFEKSSLSVYNVIKNPNDDFYVTVAYKYNDIPVFNHNLYALANKSGLKNLKGPVITFKKVKGQNYPLISVSSVLMEFINHSDVQSSKEKIIISDIKYGYYLPINDAELSTYAIPSYEIKLENGKIYYYDARENVDSSFKFLGSKMEY